MARLSVTSLFMTAAADAGRKHYQGRVCFGWVCFKVIMAERKSSYRYCFVPKCTNTTITAPGKLFVYLPTDKAKRKRWCEAARRDDSRRGDGSVVSSTLSCCEDHFDVSSMYDYRTLFRIAFYRRNVFIKINPQNITKHSPSLTQINQI